jgi:hypothetical protein
MTGMAKYWAAREPLKHHASVDNLRESAASGCHLCSLFIRSLDRRAVSQNRYPRRYRTTGPATGKSQLWVVSGAVPDVAGQSIILASPHDFSRIYLSHQSDIGKHSDIERHEKYLAGVVLNHFSKDDPIMADERTTPWTLPASHVKWSTTTGASAGLKVVAS